MKMYLVLELTRLMECTVDVYNTIHGLYENIEDAKEEFAKAKASIEEDIEGGTVDEDSDMVYTISRGLDIVELKIETLEINKIKRGNSMENYLEHSILDEFLIIVRDYNKAAYKEILSSECNEIRNDIGSHLKCEKEHEGAIEIISYTDGDDSVCDVCIECSTCNEVIYSAKSHL